MTQLAFYVGLIIILCLVPIFVKSPFYIHIFSLTLLYIIASVSLRTIIISGQFPLAHAAFMGIGAYSAGMTSRWLGLPPWLSIPLGAFVAMSIGILIGYPFARLRAIYYAMVSLFFGIGVLKIICAFGKWTGSYSGLTRVPPLFTGSRIIYYYFFLGLTSLSLLALYRFEFCRIGTNLKAISQSHLVASSIGINEARYRILVLAVGCFFVGLAGAAYAHYNSAVAPSSFDLLATLWLVMYTTVGGTKRFVGPIIGTALLVIIPEVFRDLKMYTPYISAGILLFVAFFMPQGLVGLPQIVRSWFAKSREGKMVNYVS
jgi:branched-chain amino acid transport system permease protein